MAFKITPDKKKHFFVAIPLGLLLQLIGYSFFPAPSNMAWLLAFIILVVICYGFELFSLVTGIGHYDFVDVIAGILGGVVGMLLGWAFHFI